VPAVYTWRIDDRKATPQAQGRRLARHSFRGAIMTTFPYLACILAFGFFAPIGRAEEKTAFSISYSHAGLTELTVQKGKLRYVWHTLGKKDKPSPDTQSLESYDRHQVDIRLTDKEIAQFQDWIDEHKLFDLKDSYPSASDGKSYGAAFETGLTISKGDRKHGISWVGDSKTPKELDEAVNELIRIAEDIEKSRRK
jgi:hypothetical protein